MTTKHSEVSDATPDAVKKQAPFLERLFFEHRRTFILLFVVLTGVLGYQLSHLKLDASFEKMLPTSHPYIQNYLDNRAAMDGSGNAVRIAVETTEGDIFDAEFLAVLERIHNETFFINGVDRSGLKSIWASGVRWTEVTEQGFAGGPVMPNDYDGSPESLSRLRDNVLKSGQVGTLVANDFRSAVIYAPLYDRNPETGEPLDYQRFASDLETKLREKYQSDDIKIHIIGFAKLIGDLIEGATQVGLFFAIAIAITAVLLYLYSRCWRATGVALACSMIAVIWQLGMLSMFGYGLDPFSMLVPFLVFAIAVSHGVQIINAISHEITRGADRLMASRLAFRSLYIAGLTALVSDGFGFATLMVIDIPVIQDLAVAASLGIACIILTNLVLLPLLMSYAGISRASLERQERVEGKAVHPLWDRMRAFSQRRVALVTVLVAALGMGYGIWKQQDLKIGDLDAGAPELHPDSRYNQDVKFFGNHYSTSTDLFVVMAETANQQCGNYQVLDKMDQLQWRLENLQGVQSTHSLANYAKRYMSATSEGSMKWQALSRNQQLMDAASVKAPGGLATPNCDLAPILVYLEDHQAETLERVVGAVERFAERHNSEQVTFQLAAGNAGVEAATNIVIGEAHWTMLAWVYGVVTLLCMLTFRSLRTVLCIMLPLVLTSLLCQVLMLALGIGVKVSTLPVIALGVGIGVDYGIYICSKLQTYLKQGMPLDEAYFHTLNTTGKAVAFTGLTLAIGVGTWAFSAIKFQADMGVLLAFMFLWNMVGAMVLLPALARFLLPDQLDSRDGRSANTLADQR